MRGGRFSDASRRGVEGVCERDGGGQQLCIGREHWRRASLEKGGGSIKGEVDVCTRRVRGQPNIYTIPILPSGVRFDSIGDLALSRNGARDASSI